MRFLIRRFLSRVAEDRLLFALLIALPPLMWWSPLAPAAWPSLVDWKTIGALAGLLVLSRGLEESGYLALSGRRILARIHGERLLACVLVLFSALLAAVVTNDVALFIVVPLTLGLRAVAELPVGRLIIFEALAVNAGSTASPVGNPQNLYLWQSSPLDFIDFTLAMLPLGMALTLLVLAMVPLAFPAARINVRPASVAPALDTRLLRVSLVLYPPFLLAADLGFAVAAALAVVLLYAHLRPRLLGGVDWFLLGVFVLMFIDLGLLASVPAVAARAATLADLPGGIYGAGMVLSQLVSNVPAAIFLASFTDDVRALAWGVSVGGFGLAIGSLANLIALRLAREPGLWKAFHLWSIPALLIATALGWVLLPSTG